MIYSQGSILFIGTYSDFIDWLYLGTKLNYSWTHIFKSNCSLRQIWKKIQAQQYNDLWMRIFQSLDKIQSFAKVKPPY